MGEASNLVSILNQLFRKGNLIVSPFFIVVTCDNLDEVPSEASVGIVKQDTNVKTVIIISVR